MDKTYLTAREYVLQEHVIFAPRSNSSERVPFGIYHLDAAFPIGVDPFAPQIMYIQGPEGGRKTTFVLNIVLNMLLSGKLPAGSKIAIDALENGMTIERYLLIMRCIIATKIIIYEHHTGPQGESSIWELFNRKLPPKLPSELVIPIKDEKGIIECRLTPDLIKGALRGLPHCNLTPLQFNAYERAGECLAELPIMVFGSSEHSNLDDRFRLYTDTNNIEASYERWKRAVEEEGVDQIVIDHAHEYYIPGTGNDYYSLQRAITPKISQFCKETGRTVWVLGQESQGQQREGAANNGQVIGSAGGGVLKAAAMANFRVFYNKHRDPFWMVAYSPIKARRGNYPDICIMVEPQSGALFGRSYTFDEVKMIKGGRFNG